MKERYLNYSLSIVKQRIINHKQVLRQVNVSAVHAFTDVWPTIQRESMDRALNVHEFFIQHQVLGQQLWEQLMPKISSEMSVSSQELLLRGIVDRIEHYNQKHILVELKTGSAPKEGIWPGHSVQIAAYALLLEKHYNEPINEGFVYYLDIKERRKVVINPFMKEEVKTLVAEIFSILKENSIPNYTENKNKCTHCGLRQQCYDEQFIKERLTSLA